MCKDCQRHFVENPAKGKISDEKKELTDRLLLEKISFAGIARAVGVSTAWLRAYADEKYRDVEKKQNRSPKIRNA